MSFFGGRAVPSMSDQLAAEARANATAVTDVVAALGAARTSEEAVRQALDLVRERFGWAYGSYWQVDPADRALHFVQESGTPGRSSGRSPSPPPSGRASASPAAPGRRATWCSCPTSGS